MIMGQSSSKSSLSSAPISPLDLLESLVPVLEVNSVMHPPPTHIPPCFCDIRGIYKASPSHGRTNNFLNHFISTPDKNWDGERALVIVAAKSGERRGLFQLSQVGGGEGQLYSSSEYS